MPTPEAVMIKRDNAYNVLNRGASNRRQIVVLSSSSSSSQLYIQKNVNSFVILGQRVQRNSDRQ